MQIQDDTEAAGEQRARVIEFPVWRTSPLRRRARVRRIRRLYHDQYPPLPDTEPKLELEHWLIGLLFAGSLIAALVVLIVG
jgi:hypothetical protein